MPAYRTRDTLQPLMVDVARDAPAVAIISPTPRAFIFPINDPSQRPPPCSRSPSDCASPFSPDELSPLAYPPSPASVSSLQFFPPSPASTCASSTSTSSRRRRAPSNDRRPKKGDEDYIKRPENAFILYRRQCCEERNASTPTDSEPPSDSPSTGTGKKQRQADLSKTISEQWRQLPAEERAKWEDLAKEKKKEHEQLYPHYVYRPQRKDGPKAKKAAAARGHGRKNSVASSVTSSSGVSVDDEQDSASFDTDGEGQGQVLSFVLPSSAAAHHFRRASSAPTPPPTYQTLHFPSHSHSHSQGQGITTLYNPSCPPTPANVRRGSMPSPSAQEHGQFSFGGETLHPHTAFGQLSLESPIHGHASDFERLHPTSMYPGMFHYTEEPMTMHMGKFPSPARQQQPVLQPLSMIHASMLQQQVSPSSSLASTSPGPSTPLFALPLSLSGESEMDRFALDLQDQQQQQNLPSDVISWEQQHQLQHQSPQHEHDRRREEEEQGELQWPSDLLFGGINDADFNLGLSLELPLPPASISFSDEIAAFCEREGGAAGSSMGGGEDVDPLAGFFEFDDFPLGEGDGGFC